MKLLVLEQNERVSKIYKKLFDEKKYNADFVKDESEFLAKYNKNYDYVVLENLDSLECKIRQIKPEQEILPLFSFLSSDIPQNFKETLDIIEKPFAIISMLAQLEIKNQNFH